MKSSLKDGFCPECCIGLSGHERIIGFCRNCHAIWGPMTGEEIDDMVDDAFDNEIDENEINETP